MQRQVDNYFRVGRNVFLFNSRDLLSAHRAWNDARAASEASSPVLPDGHRRPLTPIAVYRPFPFEGPWWNTDVIGFMPAGDRPDGNVFEKDVLDTWIERTELRKALWTVGAWHVNSTGQPIAGA